MLKWVFLFAVGYIAYRYWSRMPPSSSPQQRPAHTERMVQCTQCGVSFPESEAALGDEAVFCSEQHRILWKQSR